MWVISELKNKFVLSFGGSKVSRQGGDNLDELLNCIVLYLHSISADDVFHVFSGTKRMLIKVKSLRCC